VEINGGTDERTDTTDRITFLASAALSPYTSRNRKRIYEENTYDIEEQHRIIEVWIASGVFDDLRANDLTSDLDLDARRDDVGQLELPHASDAPAHHLPDSQRITSVMHTNTDALQTPTKSRSQQSTFRSYRTVAILTIHCVSKADVRIYCTEPKHKKQ